MTASTTMTIRVRPDVKEKLDRIASDTQRSKSFLAGEAVAARLLVDESAMPAIERRLAELPASSRAIVRVQAGAADQRVWTSAAQLDQQWVASLADAVDALQLPEGDGFVWAAGENRAMADLRKRILAKPGANPKRMRIASYWKQGEAGHHEELSASE